MLQLKPEVDFNLNPEILSTVPVVETAFIQFGLPLVVNSGREACARLDRRGCHLPNSAHYRGDAYDFRSKGIPRAVKNKIVDYIRQNIGAGYRLIFESQGTANEHFHFQYEPALQAFAYKGFVSMQEPIYSGGQEPIDYEPEIPIEAPLPGGYMYPVYAGETWSDDLIWLPIVAGLALLWITRP